MVWMADAVINIKLIVPSMFLEGEEENYDAAFNLPSDSDSDEEVVFLVQFCRAVARANFVKRNMQASEMTKRFAFPKNRFHT